MLDTALVGALAPHLSRVAAAVLAAWPEHLSFLMQRFGEDNRCIDIVAEEAARAIVALYGEQLRTLGDDYRWTCNQLLQEELFFRRYGHYRRSRFSEVDHEVYANANFMARYLNGLLLSQVLWSNHSMVLTRFVEDFLPSCKEGLLIEFGPGHGLFMYFAACCGRFSAVRGWDISETSAAMTRSNLAKLGVGDRATVETVDAGTGSSQPAADAIVLSEILEHVEDPIGLMRSARSHLRDCGRLFINVPINSPAPDHIFLWKTPESVVQDVVNAGLRVEQQWLAPATGYTLERALQRNVTINVVIVARYG